MFLSGVIFTPLFQNRIGELGKVCLAGCLASRAMLRRPSLVTLIPPKEGCFRLAGRSGHQR